MKIFMMLIRLFLSPLAFICLLGCSLGTFLIWVFDATYDHDAAFSVDKDICMWFLKFSCEPHNNKIHGNHKAGPVI